MAWDSPDIIKNVFKDFGYDASDAEIGALRPAFSEGQGSSAISAVANYVIAHQKVNEAQSLVQGQLKGDQASQAQAEALGVNYAKQGVDSLTGAADVYKSAPQLFGGLSPDQVSQYLKPLQNQFDYGLGAVTGQAAARGLSGSSLEATAMSQAQAQYQQQVLQQALQLGIQQQQQRAQALQSLGTGQLGLSGQFTGAGQNYGSLINQLLGQNTGLSEDLAQLPGQVTNQSIAQRAALDALNPKSSGGGWEGALGTGLGAVAGGIAGSFVGNPLMGASLGAGLGGSAASAITGNSTGANLGGLGQNYGLLASLFGKGMFGGGGSSGGAAFPQGSVPNYTGGLATGASNYGAGSTLLPPSLSL